MKKILITGGAGFIGSHLSRIYASNKNSISGCDNLVGGYVDNIDERRFEIILENFRRFENNKNLLNVVDKSLWY